MPILRSLLLLAVLCTPAFGQDGSRLAAGAKDAAQALQLYLDGVAKSGKRPDYTKPPAADLFRQVFDLEQLTALPPPKASDVLWAIEWLDAANETSKRIMFFGTTPGPNLDQEAVLRNVREYEDQYAATINFLVRFGARQGATMLLFMDQLAPEQRTPIREAGLQRARHGGGEMLAGAIGAVAVGMKPENARLITAAMRDTRDVWAKFVLPDDRTQIIGHLAKAKSMVKDGDVQKDLSTFADAFANANHIQR